jgi:hypothetical protein
MELKLGKLPAKVDKRTIKLKTILRKLPPFPARYDIDISRPVAIPYRMFLNDQLGDCVVVTKFNWLLRAEAFEQKKLVEITDDQVKKQYFKESGGVDSGLYMLDSLKDWRKNGIVLGGRKLLCLKWGGETYNIYAFASLHPGDPEDMKAAICLLNGAPIGLWLPNSAMDQFNQGKVWEYVGDNSNIGGHAVDCNSYNEIGPQYLTWGTKVQATWRFHDKFCDEGYACVDNRNAFTLDSPVDVEKLNGYLEEIEKN